MIDVSVLKSQIKTDSIPQFLIFVGDEWKVQQIYIDQICKRTDSERVYVDSFTEIYPQLKRTSFISKPKVYVVRDDKDIMSNETLQKQLESKLLRDNRLVLLLTNVDKRTRFYKHYNASMIDFKPLSDAMLRKYILNKISLSERSVARLIDICEHDYGRILLEIDKIKRFEEWNTAPNVTADDCFQVLLNEGCIHENPHDAIFDFVGAILDRNINATFDLLSECYECGEATMVMLSVLYTNAKAVLQVQSCNGKDISKTTGLTGWQIKCAQPHLRKYTNGELVNMLRLIQKLESGIKSGKYEESFVMEFLLASVL